MSVHHKKEGGKFNHFSTSFLEIAKICKKGQQRKERKQWQLDSAINFVHYYSCYISCHDTDKLKEYMHFWTYQLSMVQKLLLLSPKAAAGK